MSTRTAGARKPTGPQDHKRPAGSKPATPTQEAPKPSWWDRFTGWLKGLWNKFLNAFRVKDEEAKKNQSWFGKWILSPVMRFMGWIGKALIWVGQFLLTLLITAAAVIFFLLAALLMIVALAIYVILLVAYRIILGIGLILVTPYRAYKDRAASDATWESYWKSWNPKYWIVLDLDDIPVWDRWYDEVKAEWFTRKDDPWDASNLNGSFGPEAAMA